MYIKNLLWFDFYYLRHPFISPYQVRVMWTFLTVFFHVTRNSEYKMENFQWVKDLSFSLQPINWLCMPQLQINWSQLYEFLWIHCVLLGPISLQYVIICLVKKISSSLKILKLFQSLHGYKCIARIKGLPINIGSNVSACNNYH